MTDDTATSNRGTVRIDGHEFETIREFEGNRVLECTECLLRELVEADDDPEYQLATNTSECKIEWLEKPDRSSRGIALRNFYGLSDRQLIMVDADGDVTDTVRVHDEHVDKLASLLDVATWRED